MTSTAFTRHKGTSFALLAFGLFVLGSAQARQSDRDQPMDVKATHFDGFQKPNSVSTLTGNVVITQGSLKATGAQGKVYFDADSEISRVVLTGSPAHIQQLDDSGNLMQGDAATIDYQAAKDFAVLEGHASITQQGRGEAHGDKLTYNTRTSEMTGDSGGDGQVHMVFKPKPKNHATAEGESGDAPSNIKASTVSTQPPASASSATNAPAPATSSGQR